MMKCCDADLSVHHMHQCMSSWLMLYRLLFVELLTINVRHLQASNCDVMWRLYLQPPEGFAGEISSGPLGHIRMSDAWRCHAGRWAAATISAITQNEKCCQHNGLMSTLERLDA